MNPINRREVLRRSAFGFAAAGTAGLLLPASAEPTPPSGNPDEALAVVERGTGSPQPSPAGRWAPTEDNILGPYHRPDAPFRAKITPPLEPGDVLVVQGRVWALDSRKPLSGAVIDIWQANAQGRYDNDDPKNPPQRGVFKNRARLVTDAAGYYEYETVRPGHYSIGVNRWRPSHIHYMVRAADYKTLVTQLYFAGDKHNATDAFIKKSLIIAPQKVVVAAGTYEMGTFDIVLARA